MSAHTGPLIVKEDPCQTFNLPLPDGVEELLDDRQSIDLALIRLQYAEEVARLAADSYGRLHKMLSELDD